MPSQNRVIRGAGGLGVEALCVGLKPSTSENRGDKFKFNFPKTSPKRKATFFIKPRSAQLTALCSHSQRPKRGTFVQGRAIDMRVMGEPSMADGRDGILQPAHHVFIFLAVDHRQTAKEQIYDKSPCTTLKFTNQMTEKCVIALPPSNYGHLEERSNNVTTD